MKKLPSCCFLVCQGLSHDDIGTVRGTIVQEIRPVELVSKPAILLKKIGGGVS